ncbi:MAG TPA: gas vesicle protein GvpO [Segeticoccus sp.]|uniref:gas vesicle protein GvpO n=1 Tax=Segeticoccus sp. TaxID=2706531 RepID=UPI002D7EE9E0|nr:gas vesicle protein GvpO [Segeticoccus sp.]HET8599719.1 gas vesicle protein GvpO [Segeticoccus sp.]
MADQQSAEEGEEAQQQQNGRGTAEPADDQDGHGHEDHGDDDRREHHASSGGSGHDGGRHVSLTSVAEHAAKRLATLTGRQPEGVTAIEPDDDGWTVQIEVVESRRVPDSADILALYEVGLDESGRMRGYRRVRRYTRGRTGDD